jgi:hypothetical protein
LARPRKFAEGNEAPDVCPVVSDQNFAWRGLAELTAAWGLRRPLSDKPLQQITVIVDSAPGLSDPLGNASCNLGIFAGFA